MARILLVVFVMMQASLRLAAQCTGPVPDLSGPCTGIPLTSNTTISTGQEYYFSGGPATLNNISINGGTLRICGTLTIPNINFNEGRIIVESTGEFTLSQSAAALALATPRKLITNYGLIHINQDFNLNSDSYIINEGRINVSAPVLEDGAGTYVINQAAGLIDMALHDIIINSTFINRGTAHFRSFTVNGSGLICMGERSSLTTVNFVSNPLNAIGVDGLVACLSYSGSALVNNTLTNTSALHVCRQAGSQDPAPAGFGAATVIDPCTSCLVALPPLPIELLSFSAIVDQQACQLKWVTAFEQDVDRFVIESSTTGNGNYRSVGEVPARNQPSGYSFVTGISRKTFYRLKTVDVDGSYSYSRIIQVQPDIERTSLVLSPNPVLSNRADMMLHSPSPQRGALYILDLSGRVLKRRDVQLQRGVASFSIPVSDLKAGIYQVCFEGEGGYIESKKLVKP